MLDPTFVREHIDDVRAALRNRGLDADKALQDIATLETARRRLIPEVEGLKRQQNTSGDEIARAKRHGLDTAPVQEANRARAQQIKQLSTQLDSIEYQRNHALLVLPNLPHASVPVGTRPEDAVEQRRWSEPRKFGFPPRDHVDIGVALGGLDFDTAAKLAGARFVVMKGAVARLHRAIAQFMLDTHTTEHGYTEVYTPYMVGGACADGVTSLAKFKGDLFKIEDRDLYLIPTSEYSVTNFVRDEIVPLEKLPLKFACHSPCFRSEAGAAGKDTRGMIRNHQFDKVELVQIVHPAKSYEAHEQLTGHAETILKKLELPHRVVTVCTGDTGFSSAKTYDIEVWLPGQNVYREISSCSNFEAFQARRMQARFRNEKGKPELVHTLNGSGLAVGRTLIAVMENYQRADGGIDIPSALLPYMGPLKAIGPAR